MEALERVMCGFLQNENVFLYDGFQETGVQLQEDKYHKICKNISSILCCSFDAKTAYTTQILCLSYNIRNTYDTE